MFHPPAIDRAINSNMDSIALLDDAIRGEHLDAALMDRLLEAKSKIVVANRALTMLLERVR